MRKRHPATVLLVSAALLAGGCADLLRREPPAKQRFVLEPGTPQPRSGPKRGILRVGLVRASPTAENRSFVYTSGSNVTQVDFYHEFFAPPGVLVRDVLVDWLRASGIFAAVVRGSEVRPDWLLEADVDRILGDASDPEAPQGVVAIDVRLLDVRNVEPSLVFQRAYEERIPAGERSAVALVEAWNRALAGILERLTDDLAAAIPPARVKP